MEKSALAYPTNTNFLRICQIERVSFARLNVSVLLPGSGRPSTLEAISHFLQGVLGCIFVRLLPPLTPLNRPGKTRNRQLTLLMFCGTDCGMR